MHAARRQAAKDAALKEKSALALSGVQEGTGQARPGPAVPFTQLFPSAKPVAAE